MKNTLRFASLLGLAAIGLAPLIRAEDTPPAPASPPAPAAPAEHAHPDRATMRANRLKKLDEKLQLSDAQKQQIQEIWNKGEEQGKALRDDDSLSKDDRRAKMRDIMKASHDQVRALLTPEQQTIFDAMPPERGPRGPRHGDGDKPDDAPPAPKQ